MDHVLVVHPGIPVASGAHVAEARSPADDERRGVEVLQGHDHALAVLVGHQHVGVAIFVHTVQVRDHLDLGHRDDDRAVAGRSAGERRHRVVVGEGLGVGDRDHGGELIDVVHQDVEVHHPGAQRAPEVQPLLDGGAAVHGLDEFGVDGFDAGDQPSRLGTRLGVLSRALGSSCHHDTSHAHGTPPPKSVKFAPDCTVAFQKGVEKRYLNFFSTPFWKDIGCNFQVAIGAKYYISSTINDIIAYYALFCQY